MEENSRNSMILGVDKINGFVKNLCEREKANPEGAGFDIRVGKVYKLESEGFLGVNERDTSNVKLVAEHGKDKDYTLMPEEYVTIKTMESVNVPKNLVMYTFPRSTLHRCGVILIATATSPGYKGGLVFGLKNSGNKPFKFELGARVAHIQFLEVKGETNMYRGQWQGGRVASTEKEAQV